VDRSDDPRGFDALAATCELLKVGASSARAPLSSLAGQLRGLRVEAGDAPWQFWLLAAFASLPKDRSAAMSAAIASDLQFLSAMALRTDCPPCGGDCPYLVVRTRIDKMSLSNPRNCKTKKKEFEIRKPVVVYLWRRTCDWDAEVDYSRFAGCYRNVLRDWSLVTPPCCSSIWTWHRRETRSYTQGWWTLTDDEPKWDTTVERMGRVIRTTGPVPDDAQKVFPK
jgi:hypothetical protein